MRGGEHEVARAYVLYRERRSQERAQEKAQKRGKPESTTITVRRQRRVEAARPRAAERGSSRNPARVCADVEPERILKATLKDLYNGVAMEEVRKCVVLAARTLIEKDPAYSFVTARLLLDCAAPRSARRGSHASRHGDEVRRALPAFRPARRQDRPPERSAAAIRHEDARRGAEARARPAVRLSRAADALRPLFPRRPVRDVRQCGPPLRAAAVLFHARRHGPRAERGRARGARDRVLQRALDVRLHELDAHAVQRRHAPLAAVVVLPHDGVGRSRRHLRGDQGERAAVQVRRRPRQRLDQRPRDGLAHQGHQRQVAGRRAVPQGGQRHGGGRQPGRQAQGRRLHVSRDAGTSTSRNSWSCARTPATTAAARTT